MRLGRYAGPDIKPYDSYGNGSSGVNAYITAGEER